jgi:bifunctional enzyme CysN/CysC
MVVWMAEEPMVPGKSYWIKHTSKLTPGTISTLRYQVDVNTLHRKDAPTLSLNEIGRCTITTSQPLCFDAYRRNRGTGALIIIDRLTNSTVGAGMILDRSPTEGRHDHWDDQPAAATLHGERSNVSDAEREARFGQKPVTLLLTGLTGSGKTTLAFALERKLFDAGRAVVVLDGQNMRRGISKDLGFTADERSENLRRSAEVAKLFNDAGILVLAAFVAPDEAVRQKAADCVGRERFLVVHLDCPLETCRGRDTEGHYKLADSGEIALFPGISSPYEPPAQPDLTLATDKLSIEQCTQQVLALLEAKGAFE